MGNGNVFAKVDPLGVGLASCAIDAPGPVGMISFGIEVEGIGDMRNALFLSTPGDGRASGLRISSRVGVPGI